MLKLYIEKIKLEILGIVDIIYVVYLKLNNLKIGLQQIWLKLLVIKKNYFICYMDKSIIYKCIFIGFKIRDQK